MFHTHRHTHSRESDASAVHTQQVSGAAAAEPRIARPISYIKVKQQGRALQAEAESPAVGTFTQGAAAGPAAASAQADSAPAQGSWWVADASTQHVADTQGDAKHHKKAKAEGEKVGSALQIVFGCSQHMSRSRRYCHAALVLSLIQVQDLPSASFKAMRQEQLCQTAPCQGIA